MSETQHNLLGLTCDELADLAESNGQPRYRGHQLFGWLYARGATSFSEMTDLGKAFREQLAMSASIGGIVLVAQRQSACDNAIKFLFALHDGLRIESVLIPPASAFQLVNHSHEDEQRRLTLCVSTQVGCPLDCKFCATGMMGYRRNLTAGEILDQFLQVQRVVRKKITNVVLMGMGEPLMNYNNVMKAVDIFTAGLGIAARRITVSTAGWAENIRRMGEEGRRVKLALSLHSAVDATRRTLMPIAKKFSLEQLQNALEYYYRKTKQQVTYEHIFFEGINDTETEVQALIRFSRFIPCKINVIPFHSISFTGVGGGDVKLRPSPRMSGIVERLRAANITVMVRSNSGEDIEGACGQLAVMEVKRDGWQGRVDAG
jgi:23S rRNA (adenine2503-C2)-methyltransferase